MDIFRKNTRTLTLDEKEYIEIVKDLAEELWTLFDEQTPSREISLAKTKLEEAVMWYVKAVTAEPEYNIFGEEII